MRTKRIPTMPDPVTCVRCSAVTFKLAKPTDIDGSFVELRAAGWLDWAQKGLGRERYTWSCPACRPAKPASGGLTTGHFMRSHDADVPAPKKVTVSVRCTICLAMTAIYVLGKPVKACAVCGAPTRNSEANG